MEISSMNSVATVHASFYPGLANVHFILVILWNPFSSPLNSGAKTYRSLGTFTTSQLGAWRTKQSNHHVRTLKNNITIIIWLYYTGKFSIGYLSKLLRGRFRVKLVRRGVEPSRYISWSAESTSSIVLRPAASAPHSKSICTMP